jgi:spore coat protein A
MVSRVPDVLSRTSLQMYRWTTPLPRPRRIPLAAGSLTHIHIGPTSAAHVFANAPVGGKALAQTVWGYGPANLITSPGPTFEVMAGAPVQIEWHNDLPRRWPFVHVPHELLPVGSTMQCYDTGRTVVHLHGAHVAWTSDGYPSRIPSGPRNPGGIQTVLKPGQSRVATYPNTQPGGATLWYHDHTMDLTARNVYAGLAGFYLLRDPREAASGLPSGADEIEIALQDRSFAAAPDAPGNRLVYVDTGYLAKRQAAMNPQPVPAVPLTQAKKRLATRAVPAQAPEFKGEAICVNGALWPHVDVPAGAVRLRLLNGSSSRFFVLRLSGEKPGAIADTSGPAAAPLWQIGGDSGFLPAVAELSGALPANPPGKPLTCLVLSPGERADVVVDFTALAGLTVYLTNHARSASPLGNGGDLVSRAAGTALVLQFRVQQAAAGAAPWTKARVDAILAGLQPAVPASAHDAQVPAQATRTYLIQEFPGIPLTTEQGRLPKARRKGWNAVTFKPLIVQQDVADALIKPGLLWGGTPPDPTRRPPVPPGAVPPSGPQIEAQDLITSPTRHRLVALTAANAANAPVELWAFVNLSPDVHPLHLHHASVRLYARQDLPNPVTAASLVLPLPVPAAPTAINRNGIDPNEQGWKDTVRANPLQITWLLVRFDDAGDLAVNYTGHYVFHCHLLDHEDMGMMRPLEVHP